jgi:DNA-binding PadR family transcriptional regulator
MRLTASTLYDALARLVEQGLIEETDRSDASGGDGRRRYYRLTRLGRQVAQEEVSRLEQLVRMARTSGVPARETAR